MKIRNGFVSNSSSSSFIVAVETMPNTPQELMDMLFGKDFAQTLFDHFMWPPRPDGYGKNIDTFKEMVNRHPSQIVLVGTFSDESDNPIEAIARHLLHDVTDYCEDIMVELDHQMLEYEREK